MNQKKFKPQITKLNYNQILIDSIFDTFLINKIKKPRERSETKQNKTIYNKSLNDYIKFSNKQIKTFLFALDKTDFIILDWYQNNENLIIKHQDIIVEKIKDRIIKKYVIENKYIYYFYKHSKNKLIEQNLTPEKIIKHIINDFKYNDYKDIYDDGKIPDFIFRFLYKIENRIEDCIKGKEKQIMLDKYDDEKHFLEQLNNRMIQSIEDFLCMDNIEPDEE